MVPLRSWSVERQISALPEALASTQRKLLASFWALGSVERKTVRLLQLGQYRENFDSKSVVGIEIRYRLDGPNIESH
jgi:hypothetical protein